MHKMINNANDLAESSNTKRPVNWKSPSKSCYPNPQPGQFLVSLLKMVPPKTTSCFGCKKMLQHFRLSHKWACIKRAVAWLLLVKHTDLCIKIPVVLYNIRPIYEMFVFMSMKDVFIVFFHTLTVECYKFETLMPTVFHHNSKLVFYIDSVFKG